MNVTIEYNARCPMLYSNDFEYCNFVAEYLFCDAIKIDVDGNILFNLIRSADKFQTN